MRTHGRTLIYTKYRFWTRQSKMIGQQKPRRNDSKYHEGASLWVCTRIHPHGLSFFLLNTLLVSLFSVSMWKSLSVQLITVLSLATGPWCLVARIQHSHWFQISGQKAKPCSKPLQAEATQGENHPYTIHMKLSANQWTKNLISYYSYVIEAFKKRLNNSIQRAWPFQTSPYVPFHLAAQIYSL